MARLGRRQPFPPIMKGLIRYQPLPPIAGKPFLVTSVSVGTRRRLGIAKAFRQNPLTFPPVAAKPMVVAPLMRRPKVLKPIIKGLIQYQPIPPTAQKPVMVTLIASRFRVPRSFGAKMYGLIQYSPLPPIAAKPLMVTGVSVRIRAPRIFRPKVYGLVQASSGPPPVAAKPMLITGVSVRFRVPRAPGARIRSYIKYSPLPPIASKPFIVHFVATHAKPPKVLRPTIRSYLKYLPQVFIARAPYLVTKTSVALAARKRAVATHHLAVFPPIIVTPPLRVIPHIKIQHNEATTDQRTRVHEQQVAKVLNELSRKGELAGTMNDPSLGYNAGNPSQWIAGTPTTVKEALDTLVGQTYSGAYSVTVSLDWSIPYPVTVVSAIDTLAARVKTLESGGGSGDSITGQLLGGGARISGLQASPDIDVAATNDDEFNAALSGWTTLGALDTLNSNTIKSHLHMAKTTSGIQLDGIYKACPSMPFTVTLKIADKLQENDRECGLFVAEASPGKLYSFGTIYNAVWNKGIWSDRTTRTGNANGDLSVSIDVKYLRIVVTSSTSIALYWSLDGFVWTSAGSGINPLGGSTVGAVGIYVTAYGANPAEGVFDFIRFS